MAQKRGDFYGLLLFCIPGIDGAAISVGLLNCRQAALFPMAEMIIYEHYDTAYHPACRIAEGHQLDSVEDMRYDE